MKVDPTNGRRRCCGWFRALARALGPEPDQAPTAPPSRREIEQFIFSNEESLLVWSRKRQRWAIFTVAMHWLITILLNLYFHFDVARKFREEVDGALEFLYFSGAVSMIFFALVALADPGFLSINFSSEAKSAKAATEERELSKCWVGNEKDKKMTKCVTGAGDLLEEVDEAELLGLGEEGIGGGGVIDKENGEEHFSNATDPLLELADPDKSDAVRDWAKRRHCNICRIHVPIRAKHCKACGRCVSRMDHHCVWLGNCVGSKNHLPFLFYLVFQCIHLSYGLFVLLALFLPAFLNHFNFSRGILGLLGGLALNISLTAPEAFRRHPVRSIYVIIIFLMWIITNGVLLGQFKAISSNLLTVEALGGRTKYPYLAGDRNPFDRGCFLNCFTFFSMDRKRRREKSADSITITKLQQQSKINSMNNNNKTSSSSSNSNGGSSSSSSSSSSGSGSGGGGAPTRLASLVSSFRPPSHPPSLLPFHRSRPCGSSSPQSCPSNSYYTSFIRIFKVAE